MIQLERFESLTKAENLADLYSLCMTLSQEMGYDNFLYGVRINSSLTRPYQFIFSGYPSSWRSHYDAAGYASVDPTVLHCQKHVIPILWDKVTDNGKANAHVMQEAKEFGLSSGVTIPVHGQTGEFALLSLSSDRAPERAHEDITHFLGEAQLFSCYLHEAIRRLVLSKEAVPLHKPALTSREKECLLWAAEGKTAWEISNILQISERTIVFHMANASKKMGATSLRHATVRAVSMGLIAS